MTDNIHALAERIRDDIEQLLGALEELQNPAMTAERGLIWLVQDPAKRIMLLNQFAPPLMDQARDAFARYAGSIKAVPVNRPDGQDR